MTRTVAITLGLLLTLFLPAVAAADGLSSCTYSGSVKLDNTKVADGTLITAVIAGDEYHTHTSTGYGYSTYSLTISAPDGTNYPDGTKVTFQVNGHPTDQTAAFKAGANVRLDLAASTASVLSPSSIALISGLVFALLAAGVAVYFFFVRRRGVRMVDRLRGKGDVPSRQALPLAVKGQSQPLSRYIWDNTKLAWVLNTEPATSKSRQRGQNTSIMVDARKEAVASEQVVPIVVESQQPISRYIWDNAKLAWVQNTEPVKIKPQIGPAATSATRSNIPVVGSAGTAQQMQNDTSILVTSQSGAVAQKELVAITGNEVAELYRGNVRLLVTFPSDLSQLCKFIADLSGLRRNHMITIRNAHVASQQSVGFELFLKRPTPLLEVLKGLPEVDTIVTRPKRSLIEVKLKA